MKKFEYKMIIGNVTEQMLEDETMLQELGNEGWELVSTIYPVKPKDRGIGAKATLYYLKRELK